MAVVAGDGKVQLNRNVVNGQEPVLKLIGGLPAGTPVAFAAAEPGCAVSAVRGPGRWRVRRGDGYGIRVI